MHALMRRTGYLFVVAIGLLTIGQVSGCDGDSSRMPTQPTPPPTPPPPPPTQAWTVRGRVVSTGTGQFVAGARVAPAVGAPVVTNAAGQFEIGSNQDPEFTPYLVTVEADGHVTRDARINWQRGLRDGVLIDVIPTALPFSLEFYRQFVRNTFDAPEQVEVLHRLRQNPSFYIQTQDERGRDIDPDTRRLIADVLPGAVHEFSGGRLSVAEIREGRDPGPEAPGWINIVFLSETDEAICGRAFVAGDPGRITLIYNAPGCSCGTRWRVHPKVLATKSATRSASGTSPILPR